LLELKPAGRDIDRSNFGEEHGDIPIASQHPANRRGDVTRRQRRRCDLIEKRLEEMMIRPVYDRDVYFGVAEGPGSIQPPEPSADNYHTRPRYARATSREPTE
jgi:hypothetical protein